MKRRQSEIFSMAKAAHKYLDFLDVLLTAKVCLCVCISVFSR